VRDPTTIVPRAPPRRGRAAVLVILLALAGAAGGAWYWGARLRPPAPVAQPIGPPPVPVTATEVQRRDFTISLRGIGTVQAYNMVTVKSRVDG
jgi:multidrug efflux system membrane fusion protein